MYNAGAFFATHTGQIGAVCQHCIDQRALGVSGSGVNHHASRFVDEQNVVVFIADIQGDGFGKQLRFYGGGDVGLYLLATRQNKTGFGRTAVYQH